MVEEWDCEEVVDSGCTCDAGEVCGGFNLWVSGLANHYIASRSNGASRIC